MHTLLKIEMVDTEKANSVIQTKEIHAIFKNVAEMIKPESSFFYSENGCRVAQYVFEMKDSSQIPAIVEPFFMKLNAKVTLFPVMGLEELNRGLDNFIKTSTESFSSQELKS